MIVAETDYVIVQGGFSGTGSPGIGSPPMSSEWPTACSRNTGMFCRMKRPKGNREAVCRCLGPRFPSERSQSLSSWFSPLNPKDQPEPEAHWQDGMSANSRQSRQAHTLRNQARHSGYYDSRSFTLVGRTM